MVRYLTVAAALKLFSVSSQSKQVYRMLGNTVGARRRARIGLSPRYLERAHEIRALFDAHARCRRGDQILEIGTGWIHWESTVLRLFNEVTVTTFDVWDNRQLKPYQTFFRGFDQQIDAQPGLSATERQRAHDLIARILGAKSFAEVYRALDMHYVINPSGRLSQFPEGSFQAVFSFNVLEHVDRTILPEFVQDMYRVLKPGGCSIHSIDISDHLSNYDQKAPRKNYLRYSDKTWRRFFDNDVQYFNRVQRPEWTTLFQQAGFETVEERLDSADLGRLKVSDQYRNLSQEDLACIRQRVIHRKPAG